MHAFFTALQRAAGVKISYLGAAFTGPLATHELPTVHLAGLAMQWLAAAAEVVDPGLPALCPQQLPEVPTDLPDIMRRLESCADRAVRAERARCRDIDRALLGLPVELMPDSGAPSWGAALGDALLAKEDALRALGWGLALAEAWVADTTRRTWDTQEGVATAAAHIAVLSCMAQDRNARAEELARVAGPRNKREERLLSFVERVRERERRDQERDDRAASEAFALEAARRKGKAKSLAPSEQWLAELIFVDEVRHSALATEIRSRRVREHLWAAKVDELLRSRVAEDEERWLAASAKPHLPDLGGRLGALVLRALVSAGIQPEIRVQPELGAGAAARPPQQTPPTETFAREGDLRTLRRSDGSVQFWTDTASAGAALDSKGHPSWWASSSPEAVLELSAADAAPRVRRHLAPTMEGAVALAKASVVASGRLTRPETRGLYSELCSEAATWSTKAELLLAALRADDVGALSLEWKFWLEAASVAPTEEACALCIVQGGYRLAAAVQRQLDAGGTLLRGHLSKFFAVPHSAGRARTD